MRIISGQYKGKRITAPSKLPVRPTTDMAKEALFNILNNQFFLQDLSVLDLFSGTGNISYEFASRGCSSITAVDGNYDCMKFIKKTSTELGFPITVIKSDVFKYLEHTALTSDIIFADPPYDMDLAQFEKIIELVSQKDLLKENGRLIVEHSKHTDLSHVKNFLEQRRYGSSVFSFFE